MRSRRPEQGESRRRESAVLLLLGLLEEGRLLLLGKLLRLLRLLLLRLLDATDEVGTPDPN